jgi:hypothetical protein
VPKIAYISKRFSLESLAYLEARGTDRSLYWCDECNQKRFDRITKGLEDALARLSKPPAQEKNDAQA